MQSQPFLSCSDLSYFWTPQHGIQNIHLSVKLGERLGIIGPNGAGKSTLLKLFAGLLSPHRGQIMLNGLAIAECSLRDKARSVALLAQEPEPMISSSVYQLIELGLLPHKQLWQCTNQIDKLRIQQVLTQVGLAEKADSMVSWLSGGELQRAQVARVLLQGAQLLLLDEPTNHLDVQYQHELMQMIVNADLTLIASFHDLNLAASYCHTLMLIDQGKVLAYGSPTQVLTTENISKVFCRPCLVDTNPFDGAPRVTFAPGAINE